MLVSKYADHLPLYRQAQIYARQGMNLDRSTLADWVAKAAFLLRPVHERLFERLKASDKLFADVRAVVRLCPRRPTSGRNGPTRRRLSLRSGPEGRAADPASSGLCQNPAGRRIRGLQGTGRTQRVPSSMPLNDRFADRVMQAQRHRARGSQKGRCLPISARSSPGLCESMPSPQMSSIARPISSTRLRTNDFFYHFYVHTININYDYPELTAIVGQSSFMQFSIIL